MVHLVYFGLQVLIVVRGDKYARVDGLGHGNAMFIERTNFIWIIRDQVAAPDA